MSEKNGKLLSELPDLRSSVGRRVKQVETDDHTRQKSGTEGTVVYYYQNDAGLEGVTVVWRHERNPKKGAGDFVISDGFQSGRLHLLRLAAP